MDGSRLPSTGSAVGLGITARLLGGILFSYFYNIFSSTNFYLMLIKIVSINVSHSLVPTKRIAALRMRMCMLWQLGKLHVCLV